MPALKASRAARRLIASASRPLLHIRDSGGHAELLAADLGEYRDTFADLLMRWIGEAQPQPAAGIGLVGGPFRSRIDGDAGGERRLVQFQRIHIVRQLYPQEDTALGVFEFGRRAELLVERFHQGVELGAQAA